VSIADSEEEIADSVRANRHYASGEFQELENPAPRYSRTTIQVVSEGMLNAAIKMKTSLGLNPYVEYDV
jgi:hypothetical protein